MRQRPYTAATVLTVLLLASPSLPVRAAPPDPPSASPAPAVSPPRPLEPLRADYPDGAKGDSVVLLEITVNADGSVRSARVVEGQEPFTTAAMRASSSFRFAPATRDGRPINARIRAEIRFTAPVPAPVPEPAPVPVPGAASAAGSAAAPPPPPPPPPIEVTVHGDQPVAPGVTSMSRAEVRLLPGAFGDPFRAVESLPGVTPLVSGLPYFYVRGAPPGDVGYYLDGIRVPLLYHVGIGPSVVHPGLIDRVDLYPGAYPAKFGRFAGGIVSGETKEPADEWHGEGNLRIFDVGALVEGPFNDGRGSVLVSGRYSYTAGLFSIVQANLKLDYWDYQARVTYKLTPRDTISVFAFGSHDYLGQKRTVDGPDGEPLNNPDGTRIYAKYPDGSTIYDTFFNVGFHRVDLRYQHRISDDSTLRQSVTLGYDVTEILSGTEGMQPRPGSSDNPPSNPFVHDYMIASRTDLVARLGEGVTLRAGLDATFDVNPAEFTNSPNDALGRLFSNKLDIVGAAYADTVLELTPRFEITPGLRVDVYGESHPGTSKPSATAVAVDPRLSAKLKITPKLRMIEAVGLASQTPSFILPGPGLHLDLDGGLQRTLQISAGVEADLPEDISGSLILFRDAFFNLSDALGAPGSTAGLDVPNRFDNRSLGQSYGAELTLRRRLTRRLGGLLTYTLSRSTRFAGRDSGPSGFDRTHVINLALSYDLGKNYRLGNRILFYSGFPYYAADAHQKVYVAGRSLPFLRYDFRFEKKWNIGKKAWLSFVFEAIDALFGRDTITVNCSQKPCQVTKLPPITIPSLGLEGGF